MNLIGGMKHSSRARRPARQMVLRALARSALCAGLIGGAMSAAPARAARPADAAGPDPSPAANPLPTGKSITQPPVGTTQPVGSLPMNLVASPDGRFAVSTDMGFRQRLTSVRTSDGQAVSSITYGDPTSANKTPSVGLYYGLAFAPDNTLYAAQGNEDTIAVLSLDGAGNLAQTGTIATKKADFPSGLALDNPVGTNGQLTRNRRLYVANNDPSTFTVPGGVAIYDTGTKAEVGRFLFSNSGFGTPNFPLSVAALPDGGKLYAASQRDGGVYVLNTSNPAAIAQIKFLPTGQHPDALLLRDGLLYVANAHSDTISVVDTATDAIVNTVLLRAERLRNLPGATPTGLAFSKDGSYLYASLGDMNAVAVLRVGGDGRAMKLGGYVPAGWYPTGVVVSADGSKLLVTDAKGTRSRYPNPAYRNSQFNDNGQYDLNQIEGNVHAIPVPSTPQLQAFTKQVLDNNGLSNSDPQFDNRLDRIGLKSGKIQHVVYIVKENRTYDQVLGDLPQGTGDPSLTIFGRDVTPNLHALAERFVLLDNFFDCGEASGDGWPWSTQSIATEYVIKNLPYNYSNRGRNYDFEGTNNNYLTGGHPAKDPDGGTLSQLFPNGAPAITDVAEAPNHHIWDVVQAAGLSYRNYGFFYSFGQARTNAPAIPDNYPASAGMQPAGHDLAGKSDWDFRRYDNDYADSEALIKANAPVRYALPTYGKYNMPSRFSEFSREFAEMLAKDPSGGAVPAFMTVRFHHDHTQGYAPGKFSPRAEVADNDYACGQFIELLSNSPIWAHTAVFIIEDDSQDGPDHIDCHRSTCYVASPYVKKGTVDHTFYNTDSVLKTMEMLLGVNPMSQYDAVANPIVAPFDSGASNAAAYASILPAVSILTEQNPALQALKAGDPRRALAEASLKMNFEKPDMAPAQELNEILWKLAKGADSKMPEPRHAFQPDVVAAAGKARPAPPKDDDD